MRNKRKRNYMALWVALIVTGLLTAGMGFYLKYAVCDPLGIFQEENPLVLPFILLSGNGIRQAANELEMQQPSNEISQPVSSTTPEGTPEEVTDPTATSLPETTTPTTEPPTEPQRVFAVPVYREDESYFDDVLFIGDSRTCGLRDWNRLGDADYFCNVGMTVFSVNSERTSDNSFSDMKLSELLAEREYGKIYIALGINECGYGAEKLSAAFRELVDQLRQAQPDAVIVVNSIMTVGRGKAASASHFSLENIEMINTALSGLADGETVFYLDVNEVFADEEGYLPEEVSGDGCHLYGEYYEVWSRWLCDSVAQLNP